MLRWNVLYLTAALALCGCALSSCRHDRAADAQTVSAGLPDSSDPLDPEEFLCRLTGGPAVEPRAGGPLAGRRYTNDERATARAVIAEALQEMGLTPREELYVWSELIDPSYISPAYMENGYGARGVNLTAVLPATVPSSRWVVVGAHYDSVDTTPGADDNASGVTAVLLVAERLAALRERRANVVFVFFDQEEEGLIGSLMFAQAARGSDVDITAVHIADMIGWDSDRDRAVELTFCGNQESQIYNETMRYFTELYARAAGSHADDDPDRLGELTPRYSCRSDHVSFSLFGFRAVQVAEEFSGNDMCPHYHQPPDTCDTLDYGYLRAVAALMARAVTIELQ